MIKNFKKLLDQRSEYDALQKDLSKALNCLSLKLVIANLLHTDLTKRHQN